MPIDNEFQPMIDRFATIDSRPTDNVNKYFFWMDRSRHETTRQQVSRRGEVGEWIATGIVETAVGMEFAELEETHITGETPGYPDKQIEDLTAVRQS